MNTNWHLLGCSPLGLEKVGICAYGFNRFSISPEQVPELEQEVNGLVAFASLGFISP